ncbi:methane/phenol/toluene hydroxylase [Methylocella silvestris BL2]|uniref:Methane/phenol/toluene hydroxylase n=1 Tax=Methylocella silvestris (strain DSM 15510 / CIP 108128 / LMG 27833 / NCIMB 13906 / BL2) TaxID=395965 RepID=B8EK57_METSB|nr:toluene hydroxylase [Methylocella silvestris]ACK50597.1 methane/phenol/toluene hydroxylase [Methylocella silvestris BL2]
MNIQVKVDEDASGAAGSKTFPGSDSRRYNYFEPKGRKATHYEDVTVDVQPDPERYLAQGWIIAFANGDPTYSKDWTKVKSSNWHAYRAPDQEWERTHFQRQSTIIGMTQNVIQNGRRSGAPARFDKQWVKILQDHLGAYKHVEYGIGTALMHAQRLGYTQMVNNALLTNCSYKIRFAQDITLYLGELNLDLPELDQSAGKTHWLEDPFWQDARAAVEGVMGTNDYIEQYLAINVCIEPLICELFRSGFIMQDAAAQNDFITPSVISAGEADYERNLVNCVELLSMLVADKAHGAENRVILANWLNEHGGRALAAARQLQPLWSLPVNKRARFDEVLAVQLARVDSITNAIGLDPLPR